MESVNIHIETACRIHRSNQMCRKNVVFVLIALSGALACADELDVLTRKERDGMLRNHLRKASHEALDRRLKVYEQLQTAADIEDYQERLRAAFLKSLGGFPPRTPLASQVVGTFDGDGFRVEKVIFESRPGFHVTANLYLPRSTPPYPAVLLPCGHSQNGKAAAAYQRAAILMARNGLAVLCYDPIGQGERKQILKRDSRGKLLPEGRFSATGEHMFDGVAAILLGENLATYRIWDGMRALDYLCSRDDIESRRLGCTGNSGGGMMTSYLMALDERVYAAAPGCFITTTRRKNEKPGPGDIEQNIFGQIRYGLDHPDFILLHAPKPTLICAATKDFVLIEGTWEAFRQAKRIYTKLGVPQRVDLIEANAKHGFSSPLRVGATRWMRRWLLGKDDAVTEGEIAVFTDEQLRCTPAGQVLLLEDARSIFDFHRRRAERLAQMRAANAGRSDAELRSAVRRCAGIRPLSSIDVPKIEKRGKIERGGYRIEKLVLNHDFMLPALHFVPEKANGKAVVYVAGEGKTAAAATGGEVEKLTLAGWHVLAVDLRGLGETAMNPWRFGARYMGPNAAEFFVAYMLGQSLVGLRAEDVFAAALAAKSVVAEECDIELVATGKVAVPALHAAALEPQLFSRVVVVNSLAGWNQILDVDVTVDQLESTVHGALRDYDLPDLAKLIGADRVAIQSPVNATGNPLE